MGQGQPTPSQPLTPAGLVYFQNCNEAVVYPGANL